MSLAREIFEKTVRTDQEIDRDLIDRTLQDIGETYRPGLISWIKEDRSRWRRLLDLENRINQAALAGDELGLMAALTEYKGFFREMVTAFRTPKEETPTT